MATVKDKNGNKYTIFESYAFTRDGYQLVIVNYDKYAIANSVVSESGKLKPAMVDFDNETVIEWLGRARDNHDSCYSVLDKEIELCCKFSVRKTKIRECPDHLKWRTK